MTLDEAIQHCEEVAEKQDKLCEISVTERAKEQNSKCASEHRQLAEWLKELKAYKENTCGDAISRQAVLEGIRNLYPDIPVVDIMGARRKWLEKYAPYFECENVVEQLPSVTPQQRTGRWERMSDLPNDVDDRFECSRCGNIVHHRSVMDLRTFSRWCGRCGSYNG